VAFEILSVAATLPPRLASDHLIVDVLGSGSGLPTARRDTTALLVRAGGEIALVDCPGGVVHKLARAGVALSDLTRVILTHAHVDHVYGLPHLVHAMAIHGGIGALAVHAPKQTLELAARALDAYGLVGDDYPVLRAHEIPMQPGVGVFDGAGARILAAPAAHGRDTAALRIQAGVVALGHSSDTGPSRQVAALCRGVDLLLHDCCGLEADRMGSGGQHSSAREAGRVATWAQAKALGLLHLTPRAEGHERALEREARGQFSGPILVLQDGCRLLVSTAEAD